MLGKLALFLWFVALICAQVAAHAADEKSYSELPLRSTGRTTPERVEPGDKPQLVETVVPEEAAPVEDARSGSYLSAQEVRKLRDGCRPGEVRDPATKRCVSVDKEPELAMGLMARLKCPNLPTSMNGKALLDACAEQLRPSAAAAKAGAGDNEKLRRARAQFAELKAKNEKSLKGVRKLETPEKGILFDTHFVAKSYTIERRGKGDYFYKGDSNMSDEDRAEAAANVERLNLDLAYERALSRPDALLLIKLGAPSVRPGGEGIFSDTVVEYPGFTIEHNKRLGYFYKGPSGMTAGARGRAEWEVERVRAQALLASRYPEVIATAKTETEVRVARREEPRVAADGKGEKKDEGVIVRAAPGVAAPEARPLEAVPVIAQEIAGAKPVVAAPVEPEVASETAALREQLRQAEHRAIQAEARASSIEAERNLLRAKQLHEEAARKPAAEMPARANLSGARLARPQSFRIDDKEKQSYYGKLGQQRHKGGAGGKEDDNFIDLAVAARTQTYYGNEGDYSMEAKPKARKSPEVARLQKNINKVLQEAGVKEKVTEDGVLGHQTQSAMDIISQDATLRRRLVELQKQKE